jgi:hypothetical protein
LCDVLMHHLPCAASVVVRVREALLVPSRQHGAVELALRGFDQHLLAAAAAQFGQEGVAARPLVDDGRVAEASP